MKQRWGAMLAIAAISFLTGGWLVRREASANGNLYQRARLFENVLNTIERHYVDSTSTPELYHTATLEVISSLHDPYAELLTGDSYRQYREQISGTRRDGDNGRAKRKGDLTTGWLPEAGAVRVPAVTAAALLPRGVGYIAVRTVSQDAARELAQAITSLRAHGMRSLVLDFRHNPGGLINEGAAIADLFLDKGDTIAVTRGRTAEHTKVYVDRETQRWPDLPLAVLVNRGTASAAELATTALQDHDRAAIIGMPTYGKGVVQTTFRLGDDVALKLTTSRWYGPSGRSIQRPLPADEAEWAQPEDTAAPSRRFRSSVGRPLPSASALVPDLTVHQTPLSENERSFLSALGNDMQLYQDVLAEYAEALPAARRPTTENFEVTAAMRAEVQQRLQRSGVKIADRIYDGAADYLDEQIGYAVAREVFGEGAETRRRARDDRQLTAAAALLGRSRHPGDPIALTVGR